MEGPELDLIVRGRWSRGPMYKCGSVELCFVFPQHRAREDEQEHAAALDRTKQRAGEVEVRRTRFLSDAVGPGHH